MFYKKNNEKVLADSLFKNPTSEYRGTPFWAWNSTLEKEELERQIDCFGEMGMGGFHMHPRVGLDVEYLGGEFMDLVKLCTARAKEKGMLAWLYDEDRWPSGSAGGIITKDKKYRSKRMILTMNDRCDDKPENEAMETGETYFLGAYDIEITDDGSLDTYKLIGRDDQADGSKWYAFCLTSEDDPWFNGQAYADLLSKEAIDKFITFTYERYKAAVGDEFSKTVPAIFTDEPQFEGRRVHYSSNDDCSFFTPWSNNLEAAFKKEYGISLLESIPELFWTLKDNQLSRIKYLYNDFLSELFTRAFADNCGRWCEENNIMLTGHLMEEPTLKSQANAVGEAMRPYRGFQLPGIDMLADRTELSTAKQCQSAVHQYGREGMLSELYGVTNWDFDFRGHKYQGDWQAALGVSVRVHHLSWVSMTGEAKRDYPASISYQSSWHKEYPYIENHFARLNTALTRGKPVVRVGVLHPIESYWLFMGNGSKNAEIRQDMESNFENIINWLLFSQIDFDFIAESLLPSQCENASNPLRVGEMEYSTIIVPNLTTIRMSTLDRLTTFKNNGGRLIFLGDCPTHVDALASDEVKSLYEQSTVCTNTKASLIKELEGDRLVDIRFASGGRHDRLIYNMREDNGCYWLFICQGERNMINDSVRSEELIIRLTGEFTPVLYDTLSGETKNIPFKTENGFTYINYNRYAFESILLRLNTCTVSSFNEAEEKLELVSEIDIRDTVEYSLSEPNVLLLDRAKFSFDGGEFSDEEEILRFDNDLRIKMGWAKRGDSQVQPWCIKKEKPEHYLMMKFEIYCDTEVLHPLLAFEDTDFLEVSLNGEKQELNANGYFTDKSIKTYPISRLNKGENILSAKIPFGVRTNTEWCYILGDFDVAVQGCKTKIIKKSPRIGFGSIVNQGLPFYGAAITYKTHVNIPENKEVRIKTPFYRGALLKVVVDGCEAGLIVFPPYEITLRDLAPGRHKIEYILYGSRVNCFGPVHFANRNDIWHGPDKWRSSGDNFLYEYELHDIGIMKSPTIKIYK